MTFEQLKNIWMSLVFFRAQSTFEYCSVFKNKTGMEKERGNELKIEIVNFFTDISHISLVD